MPSDFQSKVKSVKKLTNNVGSGSANKDTAVTATSDKLFLLSYSEIVSTSYWASDYPWTSSEGTQYEAFQGKVTNNNSGNECLGLGDTWWERSVSPEYNGYFLSVSGNSIRGNGIPSYRNDAVNPRAVKLAFCF